MLGDYVYGSYDFFHFFLFFNFSFTACIGFLYILALKTVLFFFFHGAPHRLFPKNGLTAAFLPLCQFTIHRTAGLNLSERLLKRFRTNIADFLLRDGSFIQSNLYKIIHSFDLLPKLLQIETQGAAKVNKYFITKHLPKLLPHGVQTVILQ